MRVTVSVSSSMVDDLTVSRTVDCPPLVPVGMDDAVAAMRVE